MSDANEVLKLFSRITHEAVVRHGADMPAVARAVKASIEGLPAERKRELEQALDEYLAAQKMLGSGKAEPIQ